MIIVDQIPAKLTPDVIKNTGLKIMHRTLARDDRELVGAAMGLLEDQMRELAFLRAGEAVTHREGLDKPFLLQMRAPSERLAALPGNEAVRDAMASLSRETPADLAPWSGDSQTSPALECALRGMARQWVPELYGGVLGFVAMAVCGGSCGVVREAIARQAREEDLLPEDRHGESAIADAAFIHHARRLRRTLGKQYPRRYDRILAFHQALLAAWFDPEPNAVAHLAETWRRVTGEADPLAPLIGWQAAAVCAARGLDKILESKTDAYRDTDAFLGEQISVLLLGARPEREVDSQLRLAFLRATLAGNPKREEYLRIYRERFGVTAGGGKHD